MDLIYDPARPAANPYPSDPTANPLVTPFAQLPYDQPIPNYLYGSDLGRGVVRWLWPDRLPIGRLSLLVGDPGVGKSLLLADLAARLSAGAPLPPAPAQPTRRVPAQSASPSHVPTFPPSHSSAPSSHVPTFPPSHAAPDPPPDSAIGNRKSKIENCIGVVLVSPEDSPTAALQPRLVAAGATLGNILLIDGVRKDKYAECADLPFSLPQHFQMLEDAIHAVPAPRLVILDPLSALLAPDLRGTSALVTVLHRLSRLAERYAAAIVAISHLVKTGAQHVLYRVRGSLTLSGAARTICLLSADPLDPSLRVLSTIKNVYAAPAAPLSFRIAPGPRVDWLDAPQDGPSDFALRSSLLTASPEVHSALTEAAAWLLDFLAAGPRDVPDILKAAAREAHNACTLKRAKRLIAARSIKLDHASPWQWSLPERPISKESK